jgi:mitochondrial cardiolipin hydrolase
MDEIIAHLKESIADEFFSKQEKKTLKELIEEKELSTDQFIFLRSQIYELAIQNVNESNFKFILDWIRNANRALIFSPVYLSEAYFSPGDSCRKTIIEQIDHAKKHVKICVFTISDDSISDAIMRAFQKGVDVKIITDNDKSNDLGSDVVRLAKEGIPMKMDNTSSHMHHKFMVVDELMLLTGSYNWTLSAARFNQENIVLSSEAGVVKSFLNEFEKLWITLDKYQQG